MTDAVKPAAPPVIPAADIPALPAAPGEMDRLRDDVQRLTLVAHAHDARIVDLEKKCAAMDDIAKAFSAIKGKGGVFASLFGG